MFEGGVDNRKIDKVAGKLETSTVRQNYNKDEIIEIKVSGIDLISVKVRKKP